MSGLMWFLHHDNMPSNHWASPADPSFPVPQILFVKSARKEFAKLEAQLHCICSGFKSTWVLYYGDLPWSHFLFHKTYKTNFCSLGLRVYFCIVMEIKSKYSCPEYFIVLCLLFWYISSLFYFKPKGK